MGQHLRESLLILVPVLTLAYVGRGKLPVVIRKIDAPQEASALLFFRQVQEQLHDLDPVVR
jgi:hypothetical protein